MFTKSAQHKIPSNNHSAVNRMYLRRLQYAPYLKKYFSMGGMRMSKTLQSRQIRRENDQVEFQTTALRFMSSPRASGPHSMDL